MNCCLDLFSEYREWKFCLTSCPKGEYGDPYLKRKGKGRERKRDGES